MIVIRSIFHFPSSFIILYKFFYFPPRRNVKIFFFFFLFFNQLFLLMASINNDINTLFFPCVSYVKSVRLSITIIIARYRAWEIFLYFFFLISLPSLIDLPTSDNFASKLIQDFQSISFYNFIYFQHDPISTLGGNESRRFLWKIFRIRISN